MTETMSSNPCRICMGSKMNQTSIFINDLSRKVTEIADVEVQEGDGLPPTICEDCELDLEKCFKFREQIQWADSKFRESLSVSEVVFEECQIKQEVGPMHTFMNDDNQDQIEDDDDDRGPSDNDEDYEMREDPEDKTENAEKEGNQVTHPLDHVEIIERRTKQEIHIASTDQNSQEEPLIVAQNMKSENEPTSDPLMHTEPQSMETDNNVPGPSTSASTVTGNENTNTFPKNAARESDADSDSGVRGAPSHPRQGICFDDLCLLIPSLEEEPCTSQLGTQQDCETTNNKPLKVERKESDLLEPICVLNMDNAGGSRGSFVSLKRRCKISAEEKKRFLVYNDSTCFVCSLEFEDQDILHEHLRDKQFYCRVCTKEYNNHGDLEKHFMGHRCSKCQNCGKIFFSRKDYFQHMKKNESCHKVIKKYPCDLFGKTFSREATCRRHKLQNHSDVVGSFDCIVCTKSYKLPWQLNEHLKGLHVAYESIQCKKCTKLLLGPDNLRKHMIAKHVDPPENSAFVCEICNKVFSKERTLKTHRNIHDTTTCTCKICGELVVGKAAMVNHKYREHPTSLLTVCSVCGKQFDSYKSLRNHKRRDHSRDKPAFCEICGKTLSSSSMLRKHMLNHSDERRFQCEVCGASFKQRVTLYNHSRVHKEVDKYSCDGCEMTFRWKPTFDNHVKKCKYNV